MWKSTLRHFTRLNVFARRQYSETGFQDILLSHSIHKPNESSLIRCTIFDGSGNMVAHGKDFTKMEFMKLHDLIPRDFRKLNKHKSFNSSSDNSTDIVPSILTRSNSVLLNLSNVRALIKMDKVILFDAGPLTGFTGPGLLVANYSQSHSTGLFLKDLEKRLKEISDHEHLPYEFRALEAILIHVMTNLHTEMKVHQTVLQNIITGLETSIDRQKLRYLLIQSKKIAQFHQKAKLIRDLLDDLLEQDDELNELYLTAKAQGVPRQGTNHAEVEMLIESYYKTSDEIVQTAENLISQIKTSEEIISIVLDSNRNELMLLGLKFSVGLLSIGTALWIASLYGMNLENFIEEKDGGMEAVVTVSVVLFFLFLLVSVKKLSKLQKVTMTGVREERGHK